MESIGSNQFEIIHQAQEIKVEEDKMKTDKDIELEIMNKAKGMVNEMWTNREEILQNLHSIQKSKKKIKRLLQKQGDIRKEIKIIKHKHRKELGITARFDEELDEEFDEINGIPHYSKIELGIKSLGIF